MVQFKDAKEFEFTWRNNGLLPDGENIKLEDAMSTSNASEFFPVIVENFVRETIEPVLVGARLLNRINYKLGTHISFASIGAIAAADIAEGQEYPERQIQTGPGVVVTTIGKSGVAFKFTDEMKRYSQYDVVGLHIRECGRALARHKEKKIWNMIERYGVVTHDNLNPTASVYGTTGGRRADGAGNGALIVDNIFEAYTQVLSNGFTPNLIIVHPLAYAMFAIDPVLRAFALNFGGGVWFNGWNGSPAPANPWKGGELGGLGPASNGNVVPPNATKAMNGINEYSQNLTVSPKLPGYLGLPLTMLVSPYVPFNPVTKLTNIYLVDSANIGVLIVDEEITTEDIPDRLRDITKVKMRERYSVAPMNEGYAMAVLKNIKVTPNEIVTPVQALGVAVGSIDRATATIDAAGVSTGTNGIATP